MSVAEMAFIGLAVFGCVVLLLTILTAIADLVLGPDPDLRGPWDPRA